MNALDRLRHSHRKRWSPYLSGIASIFDFTGSLGPRYKPVDNPQEAAAELMARSWNSVGNTLWAAINHYRPEAESRRP